MAGDSVRLGLLGCGTVGGAVLELLATNAEALEGVIGAPLEVRRVLVRTLDKERPASVDPAWLTTEPGDVLDDPDVDIVVEVMGGDDAARGFIERALNAKKSVVSANKLLLALHGTELIERAKAQGVDLVFEASVGGGIPVVRTLRESLAGDRVTAITGILNGTSNYVLTRMLDAGLSFDDAVSEAQKLGYAEADPTMDVGGHDAVQKLCILALLGFGAHVPVADISVEGIDVIDAIDHRFAERFGFRIKHLVIGREHGDQVELRAHAALIPERSVLANVSGVLNAVLLEGQALGPCMLYGRGAGGGPTAVSVVGDILDAARAWAGGAAGLPTRSIRYAPRPLRPMGEVETRYYIRFSVGDEPGVMARLAGALGDEGVSIQQLVQDHPAVAEGDAATVVMLTHVGNEAAVQRAVATLAAEPFVLAPPRVLRIEDV